jgi:hypothetical protein
MYKLKETWLPGLLVGVLFMSATSVAQLRTAPENRRTFNRGRIPSVLEPYIRAMGARGVGNGSERIQLDGQFSDASGTSAARVTVEVPGRTRLDGMRTDAVPILFDGVTARTTTVGLSDRDQGLLESFAVESIEGLLSQASEGGAVRLLGRGFGPDPATLQPGENPPYYDVFEVTAPVATRPGAPLQTRRYYFDSGLRLLVSVRHTERGRRIETRYSNWAQADGSAYPGVIERYEADTLVFRFTTQAATRGPAADVRIFRLP